MDAPNKVVDQANLIPQTSSNPNKVPIQLSWKDIRIETIPKTGCCGK